ncbi:hypothetical protein [Streptococcus pseudoporcinus]|uniref:Uncharacterized protein n=1 Tax=Streptococcus pseudoporcinus TaxID=361101 RepID=A0A4U9XJS3_9STRE|nr:hypothetical protein [Streptococcus pseudoporcinus]QBX28167.1 hypothetical protein Javan444_0005 [Streptococcus phage Javan444]VTS13286.1 Uncharacterised protein [Streptococcus pseudoporcinus]VUC64693.1 Uncharacterised protein [Streptococcus pseudoporcinus]VUC66488.1 Uncharacterised protein [Streptococcus pseudoporcinus]VUC97417.1 Uncharacterised protein [Streptococcus pseudoporcinus]
MKNLLSNLILGTALIKKGNFTMKFTKKHQIVKSWVALVVAGTYTVEQVPKLFNLRDVVIEVLSEQTAEPKGE